MHLLPQSLNLGAALEVRGLNAAQDACLLAAQRLGRSLQTHASLPHSLNLGAALNGGSLNVVQVAWLLAGQGLGRSLQT